MSLKLYDDALLNKIRSVWQNTVYAATDEAFKASAEINKGKVALPLISLYRNSPYTINRAQYNFTETKRGRLMSISDDRKDGKIVRTLPVRLEYSLEIWAKTFEKSDSMARQLIFWLSDDPYIQVTIPDTNNTQDFTVIVEDEINQTSEFSTFEDKGIIHRSNLTLVIEDARLFMIRDGKTALFVDATLEYLE